MSKTLVPKVLATAILLTGCALYLAGQNHAVNGNGSAPQVAAPSGTNAQANRNTLPAAVVRGKAIFTTNCAFCHGANAKGGEGGPDLIRSLVVLDDDKGERIGAVVLNGRVDRGMPKFNLSAGQISDIAAFLHNEIRSTAAFLSYQTLNIVTGDTTAGEAYFNGAGKCSECHSPTGDLAHIGARYPPDDLQQKFIMPRSEAGTRARLQSDRSAIQAKVTLPSGEIHEGHLVEIDDFNLTLVDASGKRWAFARDGDTPHVELNDPLREHAALLKRYTDSDIHNLTAYLVTLK